MITIEEIYKHEKALKNFLNRKYSFETEDLEDFVSNILLKAYEKRESFDSKKSNLKTWIVNIARRQLIDDYRHSKVKEKYLTRYSYSNTLTDTSLLDLEQFEVFLKDYNKVETFYYLRKQDMDEDDIIYYMDISKETYKSLLKELNNLRKQFEDG